MPTPALDALGGLSGRLLTLGLAHATWIGLAVAAAVAWRLPRWGRLSHGARYRRLMGALGLAALGPVAATWAHRALVSAEAEPGPRPVLTVAVARAGAARSSAPAPPGPAVPRPAAPTAGSPMADAAGRLAAGSGWLARRLEGAQPALLAAWLAAVAALTLRLLLAALAVARLRRAARRAPGPIRRRAAPLARRLGLRRTPAVLAHPRLAGPCLCGLARPAVLLPSDWADAAAPGDLDAILAHELAHARRLDLPANLAQRLVEIALFFHPGVRWLSLAIRRQREFCADADAAAATGDPFALASALDSVARWRAPARLAPSLGASFGGDAPSLLPRVQELLGMKPNPPRRLWPALALPCAAALAALTASLGLAQDAPRADPPPPARDAKFDEIVRVEFDARAMPATDAAPTFKVDAPLPTPEDLDRPQTAYEVRLVTVTPGAWLDAIKRAAPPLAEDGEVRSWLWNDQTLRDVLSEMLSDVRSNLVLTPKVTAFDGDEFRIECIQTRKYVSKLKPIAAEGRVAFQPTIEDLKYGLTLTIKGTQVDGATALAVDLRDRDLTGFELVSVPAESGGRKTVGRFELPAWIDRAYLGESELPQGETLAVSLGTFERTYPMSGPLGHLLDLLREAGGPALGTKRGTVEKLVLITPQRIVLEEEEERLEEPAQPQPDATRP
jgi:hypothetical protein